jgi:hypothetical protein
MLVSAALTANTRNSHRPVIQPRRAPAAGDNGSDEWPLYSLAAANPAPHSTTGHRSGAIKAAAHKPSNEIAATAKLTTTARELLNEIRAVARAAGGLADGDVGAGTSASRVISSSCWGFPHLWQKRASSGRTAPQVQRCSTPLVYGQITKRTPRASQLSKRITERTQMALNFHPTW